MMTETHTCQVCQHVKAVYRHPGMERKVVIGVTISEWCAGKCFKYTDHQVTWDWEDLEIEGVKK